MGNTKIYTPWHWNGWIPNWQKYFEKLSCFFLPRKASNTCGISMVQGVNSKGEIALGNEFMFWSCLAWANQNTRFHVRKGRMFLRWYFLYQPLHITSTYDRVKVKVVLSDLSRVIGANPKAVLRHSPSGRSKSVERQFTIQLRWIEITGCFHGSWFFTGNTFKRVMLRRFLNVTDLISCCTNRNGHTIIEEQNCKGYFLMCAVAISDMEAFQSIVLPIVETIALQYFFQTASKQF